MFWRRKNHDSSAASVPEHIKWAKEVLAVFDEQRKLTTALNPPPPPINITRHEQDLDAEFERQWDLIIEDAREEMEFRGRIRQDLCFEYIAGAGL